MSSTYFHRYHEAMPPRRLLTLTPPTPMLVNMLSNRHAVAAEALFQRRRHNYAIKHTQPTHGDRVIRVITETNIFRL